VTGASRLVVTEGQHAGRELELDDELVLGRVDTDLELDDEQVSRRHASIRVEGNRLVLRDLGSLNGTWVNGARVAQPRRLEPGDVIRLGSTAIEVRPAAAPEAAPTPKPSKPAAPAAAVAPPALPPRRLLGGGLVAALVLQLVFAASYLGALHHPTPKHVPVAVVGPPQAAAQAAARIRAAAGEALRPIPLASPAALTSKIEHRKLYGGLVLGRRADKLVVVDAASVSVAALLVDAFTRFEAGSKRPLTVTHVKELPPGDSRGLASFYIAVAWVFGGYLGATVLSSLAGTAARGRRHAGERLGVLGLYSVISGVLGYVVAGPIIGAVHGHVPAIVGIGMLVVFATAAMTAALQALLGMAGTAVVLVVFLIVGNPSSGGPVPPELLPGFWHSVSEWLPPGAGVRLIQDTLYFGGNGVVKPLLVLVVYACLGSALLAFAGWRSHRLRSADADTEIELAAAAAAL
jgi:FHA domain